MDIGQKLKNARVAANLTQEVVAERIGVSRQTMSNWENNKSYPDIVSIISLSDLYSITLDELLKGDKNMIEYLEKSTNVIKSKQKFSTLILVISYLAIWAISAIDFWATGDDVDAMGYALLVFYLVLPVSTFVISIFIGKDEERGNKRWFMVLFFGVMYMLMDYVTFSLSNMIWHNKLNMPDIGALLPGIIISAIGISIGTIIRVLATKKKQVCL